MSFSDVESARNDADVVRHNYTGDMVAAREIAQMHAVLGDTGVGQPAVTVTV